LRLNSGLGFSRVRTFRGVKVGFGGGPKAGAEQIGVSRLSRNYLTVLGFSARRRPSEDNASLLEVGKEPERLPAYVLGGRGATDGNGQAVVALGTCHFIRRRVHYMAAEPRHDPLAKELKVITVTK